MNPETPLQAALDRELVPAEQIRVLHALAQHPEQAAQASALWRLKAVVQAAYAEPPQPPEHRVPAPVQIPRRHVVAAGILLLAVGLWPQQAIRVPQEGLTLLAPVGVATPQAGAGLRIVAHVNSAQADRMGEFLTELEMLLADASTERVARVELLFNGAGLRWLRPEQSLYQARLQALQARYPQQLSLVACNNTLERLRAAEHQPITLLAQSLLTASGVVHASLRQREGWAYIRV